MNRALVGMGLMVALSGLPAVAQITVSGGRALLRAQGVERTIEIGKDRVCTVGFTVAGRQMLAAPAREISVSIAREESNRKPRGLRPEEAGERSVFTSYRWGGASFDPARYDDSRPDAPRWVETRAVEAGAFAALAAAPEVQVSKPAAGVNRLTVGLAPSGGASVEGVRIELVYEVYDGFPAIRKWARVTNGGTRWLRIDRMVVDDLHLQALTRKPLAAAMFGVQPSVVAFEAQGGTAGLIAASEIPSALRTISEQGALGYTQGLFEWVLGPGEEFTSEPVFYFGFDGPATQTISGVSTPLDRAVEGPYLEFVQKVVGVAADKAPFHGPQWITWAYFYDRIDDGLVRQLAGILGRAGFREMLLDDGWQRGRLGTEVDPAKFPDFGATAEFIRSQGLSLGLWVSCFRNTDSPDYRAMPEARILPELIRSPQLPGFGMSFTSPWRDYYVKDLAEVARRFGVRYFKQDFTNILYGDLAEGHESRTRRESLLRGLRGLLAAQAALRTAAPDVVNEITHEIYWGTPGVPADLAALKHTARFHIPPNECIGSDLAREFAGRRIGAAEHREALLRGCWLARQRFYSHRGMPLYPLEFYAAATMNHEGSLTTDIQDRQVASWLMGQPVCYSGDARTLTEENIAHYRKRFDQLRRLDERHGIFRHFQFSGVPEPTDADWHWWGKLDAGGEGAVVVVRGSGGAERRAVNVPWVESGKSYRVTGLFSGQSYGVFSGRQLQQTGVPISLPAYGQEVLEIERR
jgi:hypothetical protein